MIFTVDFGGTRIKLGLIENGVLHGYTVIGTYAHQPFVEWIPLLRKELQALCDYAGSAVHEIEGMVWAFPLIIDPGLRHAICGFGKYDDIIHHNFCNLVEQQFQIPLLLENDARAALIGEWQNGSARGRENAVMITLGTGIGTGVIFEGKPMRGRNGMAGNLGGFSMIRLNTTNCDDEAPECIEQQVGTWALRQHVAQLKGYEDSLLAGESHVDYQVVFELAAQGDALARLLYDRALKAWGVLAINMIQAYDPECVVFGGGIMTSENRILPAIREFVNAHAFTNGDTVEIVKTQLGDRAALIGGEWIWKTSGTKHAVKLR